MPIYEFICAECAHEFESLQRLSDPPPAECPACGGGPVTKKVSAAAFRLKGGGWYETDFKNKKPAKDGASSAEGSSSAGSSAKEGASSSDSSATSGGTDASGSADRSKLSAGAGTSSTSSTKDGAS
ncbi:MAG: zinc ribbon domain-containing protein [Pseudomonadota bacterium]